MEDVFGILVVVLVYIFVIASSNSKKKQKGRQREARRARSARFDQAFSESGEAGAEQANAAKTAEATARPQSEQQVVWDLETAGEGEDPCHEGRLRPAQPGVRLKAATQEAMAHAGEGENPCHEAPRRAAEGTAYDSPIYAPAMDRAEFARQALCGVVMSEVLKRPYERRLERKLRRGA